MSDEIINKSETLITLHRNLDEPPIGAAQSINITETKDEENGPIHVKVELFRVRLARLKIAEIFSRGVPHAKAQRYPIQIVIVSTNSTIPNTVIKNVWIREIESMGETGQAYVWEDWVFVSWMECEAGR
jgi:hypothetical protein